MDDGQWYSNRENDFPTICIYIQALLPILSFFSLIGYNKANHPWSHPPYIIHIAWYIPSLSYPIMLVQLLLTTRVLFPVDRQDANENKMTEWIHMNDLVPKSFTTKIIINTKNKYLMEILKCKDNYHQWDKILDTFW